MADDCSNDSDGEALGPSSCALGPHPVEILDGKHLCTTRKSFRSATIYAPKKKKNGGTGGGDNKKTRDGFLLPSIVIVGGWGCGETILAAWGPFLASHGIVATTIGSPEPFRDMPADRSMALLEASRALQGENDRAGSALRGRLDVSRRAVMGLSPGGGGAQIAALEDPSLGCIVALCPHDGTNPPPALCLPDVSFPEQLSPSVPVLIVAGEKDDVADPKSHAWPMYHKSGATKLIMEVSGGDHGFAIGPAGWSQSEEGTFRSFVRNCRIVSTVLCINCCGFAFPFEGAMEGRARERSPRGAIGGVVLAWLRLFLLGEEAARSELVHRPSIASGFESSGVVHKDDDNNVAVETTRGVPMERE